MKTITTGNPQEASEFVFEEISKILHKKHSCIVALSGGLGAGKTTLVQWLCKKFNIHETITSPTFPILNIYEGEFDAKKCMVYHFDWYRLESEDGLGVINLDKIFSHKGLFLIEWPEQLPKVLEKYDHVTLMITEDGDIRTYNFEGSGTQVL